MPIEGLSEIRRLPRLGIIRLGEKAESAGGKEYPKKLDHFNMKDAPAVASVFGSEAKSIEIMIPHEDPDVFFPQWRKAYGKTTGLFCKGDGKTASRVRFGISDGKPIDGKENRLKAGQAFDMDGEKFIKEQGLSVTIGARFNLPCLGQDCPFTVKKICKTISQFLCLIPKVPGIGVYQISSTSRNGIIELNSYIDTVRNLAGRVSMIPLTLSLVPKKVTVDGKAIGIFHLKLEYTGLITDLVKYRNKNYLSKDLMPDIEHETPRDIVLRQGQALDEELNGGPVPIDGPEDGDIETPASPAAPAKPAAAVQPPKPAPQADPSAGADMFGDAQDDSAPTIIKPGIVTKNKKGEFCIPSEMGIKYLTLDETIAAFAKKLNGASGSMKFFYEIKDGKSWITSVDR